MSWRRQDRKVKQVKPIKPALYCFLILMFLVACSSDQTTSNASPTETVAEPTPLPFVSAIPDISNARLIQLAGGFERPLFLTHAGDGSGRLFVVEQTGSVHIIRDGEVLDAPFLNVSELVGTRLDLSDPENSSENGLLGLAFHPDYHENGYFFIYYTDQNLNSLLARYQVSETNPNIADPESGQEILSAHQPYYNHNGGMLAFGPDGYLYLGLGDGGEEATEMNSQMLDTLLGSILRLDVSVAEIAGYSIPPDNPFVDLDGARPEIWAYGLRNPWRFSFDRVTGDLWIGDVGAWQYEELNYQPADSAGGENYGWPHWNAILKQSEELSYEETSPPIFVYPHDLGLSIIAGYVYRGNAINDLFGVFLFGDFGSGRIWTIYRREDGGWQVNEYIDTIINISSFGEDEDGELYIVDYSSGSIWKFVPRE